MKVGIGDRVRFLNEVGGGIVTRIEGNLVFVEDEDGFEVPVPVFEVVVVEQRADLKTVTHKSPGAPPKIESITEDVSEKEAYHEELEEDGHDDFSPSLYLGFIKSGSEKGDDKLMSYFINDSNYYCTYLISQLGDDGYMYAMQQGVIEPNTKLPLLEKTPQELDITLDVQLILFKKGKPYPALKPVSNTIHVKAKRFFKDNSFVANDFFHQPAVLLSIIKSELEQKLELLTERETAAIIKDKEIKPTPKVEKRKNTPELLEVDLHIQNLMDNTSGLSSGEILNIQIDRFNAVMEANRGRRGMKVVFIHGVGNGVLKTEIRKLLERKYKGYYFQDASFKEYGYGATMVIMK